MAKRFKVNIPNIRNVYNDEIGQEERDWLKVQHPADYAYLLHLEEKANKVDVPQDAPANTPKAAEAEKVEGAGGKK